MKKIKQEQIENVTGGLSCLSLLAGAVGAAGLMVVFPLSSVAFGGYLFAQGSAIAVCVAEASR